MAYNSWTVFIYRKSYSGWWFFATPLKNMSSSIGMITFSNIPNSNGKIKSVLNH